MDKEEFRRRGFTSSTIRAVFRITDPPSWMTRLGVEEGDEVAYSDHSTVVHPEFGNLRVEDDEMSSLEFVENRQFIFPWENERRLL